MGETWIFLEQQNASFCVFIMQEVHSFFWHYLSFVGLPVEERLYYEIAGDLFFFFQQKMTPQKMLLGFNKNFIDGFMIISWRNGIQ